MCLQSPCRTGVLAVMSCTVHKPATFMHIKVQAFRWIHLVGSVLRRPSATVRLRACLDCNGLPWHDMLPTSATPVLTSSHCLGLQGSRSLQQLHQMNLVAAACACSTSWQLQHLRLKPWLGQRPRQCLCWWQPWDGEWQVRGEQAI